MSQTPDPGQTDNIKAVSGAELTGKIACAKCGLHLGAGTSVCPNDGTVLLDSSSLAPKLGAEYEFITEIGSGGMGVIYKARHLALNQVVAIKMLHANRLNQASFLRFQQEARAISSLDHPGIVRVRDFGISEGGQPHLILDFIQGKTLAERIAAGGPLSPSDAIDIFIDVTDALAHAHERGILHRDLKPSNIMLIENKGRFIVKIVDFGIAKMLAEQEAIAARGLTQTGEIFGSPLYMSPEQVSGETLDFRADIYSLGCVLFEALTGTPPFASANMIEVLFQQVNDLPPTLKEASLGKTFAPELEMIVGKALRKNRSERFTSMSEFKDALIETRLGKRHESLIGHSQEKGYAAGRDKDQENQDPKLLFIGACALMILFVGFAVWAYCKMTEPPVVVKPPPPNAFEKVPRTDDVSRAKILASIREKKISFGGWVTDEALSEFDKCSITEDIDLGGSAVNGEGLKHLIHLPLRRLKLRHADVADVGLIHVGQMTTLEDLNIQHTTVTDVGLEPLKNLTRLKKLNVAENKIGDMGMDAIAQIASLEWLNIANDDAISTTGMLAISALPHLHELILGKEQFESFLMVAKNFKTLQVLNARKVDVSKLGKNIFNDLQSLPLQELKLHQAKLTEEQFASLARLRQLKTVQLSDLPDCGNINRAMRAQLSKLRPDVKIELVKEVDPDPARYADGDF